MFIVCCFLCFPIIRWYFKNHKTGTKKKRQKKQIYDNFLRVFAYIFIQHSKEVNDGVCVAKNMFGHRRWLFKKKTITHSNKDNQTLQCVQTTIFGSTFFLCATARRFFVFVAWKQGILFFCCFGWKKRKHLKWQKKRQKKHFFVS